MGGGGVGVVTAGTGVMTGDTSASTDMLGVTVVGGEVVKTTICVLSRGWLVVTTPLP